MLGASRAWIVATIAAGGLFWPVWAPDPLSGTFAPLPERPMLNATFTLHDGWKIPVMGLGSYKVDAGEQAEATIRAAVDLGYRMFDTAADYDNERSVGKAIRESGIPRRDLFIATKLDASAHGYQRAHLAVRSSLRRLGVDYLDLYLLVSPAPGRLIETWDALMEMRMMGLVRSIGVSNFDLPHLEALETHGRSLPAVNQIELHPLNWKERRPLLEWCKRRGVLLQAYGSIFAGRTEWLAAAGTRASAAAAAGRSPAQILLRWGYQMGFQLIPKSVRRERLLENAQIFDFELEDEEMHALSDMQGELGVYQALPDGAVDLGVTSPSADRRIGQEL